MNEAQMNMIGNPSSSEAKTPRHILTGVRIGKVIDLAGRYVFCPLAVLVGKFFYRIFAFLRGEQHPATLYFLLLQSIGLCGSKRWSDAERPLETFYAHWQGTPSDPTSSRNLLLIQGAYFYSSCLLFLDRYDKALRILDEAYILSSAFLGTNYYSQGILQNLITCLVHLGQIERAAEHCRRLVDSRIEIKSFLQPYFLRTTGPISLVLMLTGNGAEAIPFIINDYYHWRATLGEEHPETLATLNFLVRCLLSAELNTEAARLAEYSSQLHWKVFGDNHLETAKSLNLFAECLSALGLVEEARPFYEKAVAIAEQILDRNHRGVFICSIDLARCLWRCGRLEEALSRLNTFLPQFLQTSSSDLLWIDGANILMELIEGAAQTPRGKEWSAYLFSLSQAYVKAIDLQPPEQLAAVRINFQDFYRRFLKLCLTHQQFDLLPHWHAAVQGRQLARLMIDALISVRDDDPSPTAEKRRALQKALLTLRQKSLGLQVLDGGRSLSGPSTGDDPSSTRRGGKANTIHRSRPEEDYHRAMAEFERLWKEIQQLDPTALPSYESLDVDVARLRASLVPDQAVVLLIQERLESDSDLVHLAFVISSPPSDLRPPVELPAALGTLPAEVAQYIPDYDSRPATRKGGSEEISGSSYTLKRFTKEMAEYFWQPIQAALAEVREVHIVTHGQLHILPYELGCPDGLTVYTYPGLAFYLQRQQAPSETPSSHTRPPLAVAVYDAYGRQSWEALPLVNAEEFLLQDLWGQEAVKTFETPGAFWHLASHGDADDPLHPVILRGPEEEEDWTIGTVLSLSARPSGAFLSVCVTGQVHPNADGEPLGFVSALLARGARYVIAALTEVPDLYMPVLVCLFYQSLQRVSEAPAQALAEAKRRFRTREWYADTRQRLRRMYLRAMTQYLARLEEDEERYWQVPWILKKWWNPTHADLESDRYTDLPPDLFRALQAEFEHNAELRESCEWSCATNREAVVAGKEYLDPLLHDMVLNPHAIPEEKREELCAWVRGFGAG